LKRLLPVLGGIVLCGTLLAALPKETLRLHVSDTDLVGNVRSALHASLGDAAAQIDVRAQEGFVFLYGEAPSERLRARAETIAERVAGVRAVANQLVAADRAEPVRPILGGRLLRRPE